MRPLALLVFASALATVLGGCSALSGESEAPKPDPSRFLPKGNAPQGPSAPPAANSK